MRVKQTTISYLAGIVDGEGYIGIKKSNYLRHCPSPTYHERIQIRMINEEAIKLFQKVFGGSYYKEKDYIYCFQISDLAAANTLKILLPYLKIKKRQAELCLKLRKSKESKLAHQRGNLGGRKPGKGKSMSKKVLNYRDKLWKQIKQIHRGTING